MNDAAASGASCYRGSDRRTVARGVALSGRFLVRWTAGGAVGILLLATTLAFLTPGSTIDLWPVALAFWCTLMVGSGIALLVAWRIGGWARPGQLGTAMVALSLLVSLLPRFSEIVAPTESLRSIRPLGTTVAILVAAGYILRSLRGDDVDTTVRPVRDLLALVGLMVLGILAGATLLMLSGDGLDRAFQWGPAAASIGAACATIANGGRSHRVITQSAALMFLLMGIGSFAHHASSVDLTQAVAATAMCLSSWVAAGVARDRLRVALAMHDARSLQTLATLGKFSSEMSLERQRRHDALNAVAAIRSAAEVLTTHGQDLDAATRTELSLATRAELARVERMLAPSRASARDAVLADVLRPVVLARRHRGMQLDVDLGKLRVWADPDIVARIIENLLQNAERHAAGSRVQLVGEREGDLVRISVSDDGPGIPAQRRAEVFAQGVTSSAHGQGLGLSSALRLARDQGGDLRLTGADQGCCFVLTLPHATAAAAARPSSLRAMHAQAG